MNMKTAIRTILCAVAVVMAAVSCQKSIEPANPAEEGKGTIDICVNGLMGEYTQQDGVKSSLVNNVRVAWAAGDVVYVFDGSKYLGKLTAALDKKADGKTDEDRYAKLGGTINAPATTPCVLSLVHSSLMTEPETGAAVSELSIDMRAQSTATVPFVAYATLKYTGTTITDVVVPFQFATSVIKVNCTGLKANTAIDKATLSNVNTACKLILSGSAAPTVSGGTNGTITKTGDAYFAAGKVNAEGEAVFQIAVPALEEASQARVLTVAQGAGKVKDKNFSMKGIEPATSVNTVCQLSSIPLPAGALPGEFSVSATKQVYFSKGNLYVDARATPVSCFEANQYDFRTYPGKGSCINGTYNQNSGTPSGYYGLFKWSSTVNAAVGKSTSGDFLFTNDPYDAKKPNSNFTVKVGDIEQSGWRTLTMDEWQYLFNTRTFNNGANTGDGYSYQRATINFDATSVFGMILYPDNYTSQTDATSYTSTEWATMEENGCVFLPAAGVRSAKNSTVNVSSVGVNGNYWSSTAKGSSGAYRVSFSSGSVSPEGDTARSNGYSVRLVTECQ